MRCIRLVMALALTFGLAGCAHPQMFHKIGNRTFYDDEEARAYQRTILDQMVAEVQPLPAPIAGPAIVISPTRAQWEDVWRGAFPDEDDQQIRHIAERSVADDQTWFRVMERRNIFQSIRHVEAESPDGTQVPPGGYLIWLELRRVAGGVGNDFHIVASGEVQRTTIDKVGSQPVPGRELMKRVLQAIEEYVKTHPAAG